MPVEKFIDFLAEKASVSDEFKKSLEETVKTENYHARQIIFAAGQVESRLWFLEKGFARSYYFDLAGKEHTTMFYDESDLIFSFNGYWREPSENYLEVLHPSSLISLAYDEMVKLLQLPETKTLIHYFARQRINQDQFTNRLMGQTAIERYRQYRKAFPGVFRKASVRLIASYLNMTRENLSRLIGRN
jgi:CRP-like cAMP-binding protein